MIITLVGLKRINNEDILDLFCRLACELRILNNESVDFAIFSQKVFKKLRFNHLQVLRFREWSEFEKESDSFTFPYQ